MAVFSLPTVRWRETLVVMPVGELSDETADAFPSAFEGEPTDVEQLVLDLRNVSTVDAAGVAAIATARAYAVGHGWGFVVVRPAAEVAGWTRSARAAGRSPVVDSLSEALRGRGS